MKNYAVNINGKTVIYKSCITCTVRTSLSFWQRIRVLFGGEVITSVHVYTKEQTTAVGEQVLTAVSNKPLKK